MWLSVVPMLCASTRSVYVTGFGPFGDVAENPSCRLVRQLASVHVLDSEIEVCTTSVDEAVCRHFDVIKKACHSSRPVVLHYGVDCEATAITIEICARNYVHVEDGGSEILLGGPASIETTYDLNQVLPQLPELFCASSDAGDYLCNYMYYKSLVALNKVADVLFIHVPTFDVIPETVQLEGLNLLVSLL